MDNIRSRAVSIGAATWAKPYQLSKRVDIVNTQKMAKSLFKVSFKEITVLIFWNFQNVTAAALALPGWWIQPWLYHSIIFKLSCLRLQALSFVTAFLINVLVLMLFKGEWIESVYEKMWLCHDQITEWLFAITKCSYWQLFGYSIKNQGFIVCMIPVCPLL